MRSAALRRADTKQQHLQWHIASPPHLALQAHAQRDVHPQQGAAVLCRDELTRLQLPAAVHHVVQVAAVVGKAASGGAEEG